MNIIIKGIISVLKNKTTMGFIVKVLSKLGVSKFYLTLITGVGILGGISYISAKLTYQYVKSDYPTFGKFILDSLLKKLGLVTSKELQTLQNYVNTIENKVYLLEQQNNQLTDTIQAQQLTMNSNVNQMNITIGEIENVSQVIANETSNLKLENQIIQNKVDNLTEGVGHAFVQIEKINERTKNMEQNIEIIETGFQVQIDQLNEVNEENSMVIENLKKAVEVYNSLAENLAVPVPLGLETDNMIVRIPVHQIELKTENEIETENNENSSGNIENNSSESENSVIEYGDSDLPVMAKTVTNLYNKITQHYIDKTGLKGISMKTTARPMSALSRDIKELREHYSRPLMEGNQNSSPINSEGVTKVTYGINFSRISTDTAVTNPINTNIISQNINNNNNSNYQFYNPQTFDFEKYEQATGSAWWVSMRYRLYGFLNRTMNLNLGLDPEVNRLLSGNLTPEDINNLNNGVSTPAYDIYRLYFKKLDIIPPHVSQGLLMNQPSNRDIKQIEMPESRPKPKISLSKTSITLRQRNKHKLLIPFSDHENE